MRPLPSAIALVGFGFGVVFAAAACEQLDRGGANGTDGGALALGDAAGGDAGVTGAGCGAEATTGTQLCTAVSTCPSVVVDTQATPGCGFRIRGAVVDLVCACGEAICPMGAFTTCAEAARLLTEQTPSSVCTQLAEGRCTEVTAATPTPPASDVSPACDRQCVRDCGGGAACAAVCNCD